MIIFAPLLTKKFFKSAFRKAINSKACKQKYICGVEQLVARRAHNPKVIGSSPVPATKTSVFTGVFFFIGNVLETF